MLTVPEIKEKSLRQFKDILRTLAKTGRADEIFPLVVRGVNSNFTKDLKTDKSKIDALIKNSKNKTGHGFTLIFETVNTRSNGSQTVIKQIQFDSLQDYLNFTGLTKDFNFFEQSISTVRTKIRDSDVDLDKWIFLHIADLCDRSREISEPDYWTKICECVNYLRRNKKSGLYLRQLPLEVHTKFIEENKAIIHSLISEEKIQATFEADHGLREKPNLIRFRRLDGKLTFASENPTKNPTAEIKLSFEELSLPLSDFFALKNYFLQNKIHRFIIVENEIVFLTFPQIAGTICIWGHGYTSSVLQSVDWLNDFDLIYFGDLDEHGFDILEKFRSHFPKTKSLCMNIQILQKFDRFRTKGKSLARLKSQEFEKNLTKNLTPDEKACLNLLLSDEQKNRLEQEHIDNKTILEEVERIF